MKRFVLSVFLLFAGLSIFAQSYDDWNRLFTENKKGNLEETYSTVAGLIENGSYPEIMKAIFELYAFKCSIVDNNTENLYNTTLYNSKYDAGLKQYSSSFINDIKNFVDCLKDNELFIYNVTNLNKYDISTYFQPVSVRELELVPARYEGKKVEVKGRYQYTAFNKASFLCFDSSDGWRVVNFPYSDLVAIQLLDMVKNEKYKLCGTVTDGQLTIEYLELY